MVGLDVQHQMAVDFLPTWRLGQLPLSGSCSMSLVGSPLSAPGRFVFDASGCIYSPFVLETMESRFGKVPTQMSLLSR